MEKCPYCSAETRPGDNFCLNCGNRLLVATPSFQQAQPVLGDATLPAEEDWVPPAPIGGSTAPASNSWSVSSQPTIVEPIGTTDDTALPTLQAMARAMPSDKPPSAHVIIRNDKGEVLNERSLEKLEMSIGRAPNSDIRLEKDKLTSRRHATIRYENGTYVLQDEHSANGTFVNGQQLEDATPWILKDGDHVGIGEHELIFRASIEDLPTIAVPLEAVAATEKPSSTQEDKMTPTPSDELRTRDIEDRGVAVETPSPSIPATPPTVAPATPSPVASATNGSAPSATTASPPTTPAPAATSVPDTNVTFNRLTSLPQPTLPNISELMAALTTLDGQVSLLQEQLNSTQEAIRSHETDIAQAANQLRSGVRHVSERMDSTIADVARSREALAWADLLQLMEDVMNNPRDIEYVTKLARKARELNKVFQIHQTVLNTLAECNSLLRSLIGDDRA